MLSAMDASNFAILGEPTRLRILRELAVAERNVGDLVSRLKLNQPAISKHLKVLRDAGFVECRIDAQKRIYRIDSRQFEAIDAWLEPYRQLWTRHLVQLENYLDKQEDA